MISKKYIFVMCGMLLMAVSCTNDTPSKEEMGNDGWTLTRSAESNIDALLMVGKHKTDQNKDFRKKLSFTTGTVGVWEDNTPPAWKDGDSYDLIALYPAVTDLPADDRIDDQTPWQMQFWADRVKGGVKENRPTSFLLTHLMGQLKVHVTIKELSTEDHEPKDMLINFYTQGKIDYLNMCVLPLGEKSWKSVSGFVHEKIDDDATTKEPAEGELAEHKWVMDHVVTIIPQILKAGELAVTFYVDDSYYGKAAYEFIPDVDLTFAAGKTTHLYLGVVYEHGDEPGDIEPEMNVVECTVKVTDWTEDDTPTSGTATPQS